MRTIRNAIAALAGLGCLAGVAFTDGITIPESTISAGGLLPAVNGSAITNSGAANIAAGGAISAVNGAAITNLTYAALSNSLNAAVIAAVPVTNTYIKGDTSTGTVVIVDVGGFSIIKSW